MIFSLVITQFSLRDCGLSIHEDIWTILCNLLSLDLFEKGVVLDDLQGSVPISSIL